MRTKAIVIRKMQANEYDQIVTLYSEDYGTMRAIARGVCKPTSVQSMHLELLNAVEFEVIHGKSMPIISSAIMSRQHLGVKESLPKLAAVQFFTEVLDKISFENEKDAHLWEFLNTMLTDFDGLPAQAGAPAGDILPLFRKHQAGFLKVLGYAPQIERCVICSVNPLIGPDPAQSFSADRQSAVTADKGRTLSGAGKVVALSTELGGIVCEDCFLAGGRGIILDKADLGLLAGAGAGSADKHSTLDTFFEYTVGRKISSLNFLYQVIK